MSIKPAPYFDDLNIGDVFDAAPSLTLTCGRAAAHQVITGGSLRLSLDSHLSQRVAGAELADPALVWDVAIGQSTRVTQRVIANLFYRGLAFYRIPALGDTLTTTTEVVGLRQTASRNAGLAVLRITTRDQNMRLVLDFWRCAMLPLSAPEIQTGHADDLSQLGRVADVDALMAIMAKWDLTNFPEAQGVSPGATWEIEAGDVVGSAPELARLTLNVAHVHHDRYSQAGGRLVYGGHTIGIALAHVTRNLPDLITVAGWDSCDHKGPVREGDTLTSTIEVLGVEKLPIGVRKVSLRVQVSARRYVGLTPVLDWRLLVIAR